ncbi:MAG TPA: PQQ-binding-like beta-propeller repeat protein, partial [Pirellulales bacterium]
RLDGMGQGFAAVSVAGGKIYTTGNVNDSQSVLCIDEATQKIEWTAGLTEKNPKHGYDGSRCTPSIDGDLLFVVTSNGAISCLKKADGSVVWQKDFRTEWGGKMMSGWGFSESPLVDGDLVLCTPGGADAMIVALKKATGEEVWRSAEPSLGDRGKDGAGYSSIVVSNGAGVKQYVTLTGRGLIGVRASDGKFLWGYNRVANNTANIPTPLPSGDYVFGASGYGTGGGLVKLTAKGDGVDAEEVYFLEQKTFQNHHGGMLLHDGYIYAGHGHNNGFPICLDYMTGDVKWGGERGPGKGSAAVTYYDGHVIFRYQSGEVALFEAIPTEKKAKGVFKPEVVNDPAWAQPVVANGKLYLRDQNTLMVYDLSAAK